MPLFGRRVGRADEFGVTRRRVARGPGEHLRARALAKRLLVEVQSRHARADDEPNVIRRPDGEAGRASALRGPRRVVNEKVLLRLDAHAQTRERPRVEYAKLPRREAHVEACGALEKKLVGVLGPRAGRQLPRCPLGEARHEGRPCALKKNFRVGGQPPQVRAREALVERAPSVKAQCARRFVERFEARSAQVVARARCVEQAARKLSATRGVRLVHDQVRDIVARDLRAAPVNARRLRTAPQLFRRLARRLLRVLHARRAGECAQARALRLELFWRFFEGAPEVFDRRARPEVCVALLRRLKVGPALEPRVMLEPLALDGGEVCDVFAPVVARIHFTRSAPLTRPRRERFYGVRASPYARAARLRPPTAGGRTTPGRTLKGSALRSVRLYHEGKKGRLAESGPRRTGRSRFVSAYKSRARQTWGMPRPLICGHCPHPSNH